MAGEVVEDEFEFDKRAVESEFLDLFFWQDFRITPYIYYAYSSLFNLTMA